MRIQSINQPINHACATIATRSYPTAVGVPFRFEFVFCFFVDVAFSDYFVPLPFSPCTESYVVVYVLPFRTVFFFFFYLVTTGWIFSVMLMHGKTQSINQSMSTI